MHLPLLQDILILLGFSVVIVFVLQRLKLPSIIGFLLTGVIIGPYGLSLRTDNYQLFKGEFKRAKTFRPSMISDFNITCLRMNTDSHKFLGKPLRELNLRAEYGINILGIKRRDQMLESVQPEDLLKQGDMIYIQGSQSNIERFHKLIK